MKNMTLLVPALIVALLWPSTGRAEDFSSLLMRATYKLAGPQSGATAFLVSRPLPADPQKNQLVLVTAGHVLDQIKSDQATLHCRQREADETFKRLPVTVALRQNGKPLWTKHPTADVAVLPVTVPEAADVPAISLDCLANDDRLKQLAVHPGDTVLCLGFPHNFEGNQAAFPVLRSGLLTTVSMTPAKQHVNFLVACNTFEGDSGGPVYLAESNRVVAEGQPPQNVRLILGLIHAQHFVDMDTNTPYEIRKVRHRLGLAIVIHAALIRETIEQLAQQPADK